MTHILFCQLARLRNNELGTLDMLTRNNCRLCSIISDAITKTWRSKDSTNGPSGADTTYSMSGPYFPCGMLNTGRPASEASSPFYEHRAIYRISAPSLPEDHSLSWIDLKLLLAYPRGARNSFVLSTWESLPGDLSSLALELLESCKRKHPQVCGTRETVIKSALPHHFGVIDVRDHCIVYPPNNLQYLALSYVWGPPGTTSAWLSASNMLALGTKGGACFIAPSSNYL